MACITAVHKRQTAAVQPSSIFEEFLDMLYTAHLSLPFPCVPDRPYKILLVQVGTLSFSHPSFGVPLLFIY